VSFSQGQVYVGTWAGAGSTVRKVSPQTDLLSTPAGTNSMKPLGDHGPAVKAALRGACAVASDTAGNLRLMRVLAVAFAAGCSRW
jgi:hypothetical protein